MKKILPGFLALVVAIAASAFTAPSSTSRNLNEPHWFDENGDYIGQRSEQAQRDMCEDGNVDLCAKSYSQITQNQEPVQSTYIKDLLRP